MYPFLFLSKLKSALLKTKALYLVCYLTNFHRQLVAQYHFKKINNTGDQKGYVTYFGS